MLYDHEFEGSIVPHKFGRANFTVVWLPEELVPKLPFDVSSRLRIEASIGEFDFPAALQPAGGRWYLLLGKKTRKAAEVAVGETVLVRFRVVDQDSVDVPEPLQKLLDTDDDARANWEDATAGRRRNWAYRVSTAKRPETIAKRLKEVRREMLE